MCGSHSFEANKYSWCMCLTKQFEATYCGWAVWTAEAALQTVCVKILFLEYREIKQPNEERWPLQGLHQKGIFILLPSLGFLPPVPIPVQMYCGTPYSGNEMPSKQGSYANRHISKTNSKILNTAMTFSFLMAHPGNNFRSHSTEIWVQVHHWVQGPGGHGPAPSSLPSVGTNRDMSQSSTSVFS